MRSDDAKRRLEQAGVRAAYTIAFSMRCGSTILSRTLDRLGVGHPTEYFQYPYAEREYFARYPAADPVEQFVGLAAGQAQDGWFGSKMSHDHRAHLDAHLQRGIEGYRLLDDVLPRHKWVFMRRRDIVAQALSLYIAEATERWHIASQSSDPDARQVPYDFFDILAKVAMLATNNVNWDAYFAAMGIEPHRLVYEDLVADPRHELGGVLRFLGVERDVSGIVLEREGGLRAVSRLSAANYAELRDRFTGDFIHIGRPDDAERLGPDLERWTAFFFGKGWRAKR